MIFKKNFDSLFNLNLFISRKIIKITFFFGTFTTTYIDYEC